MRGMNDIEGREVKVLEERVGRESFVYDSRGSHLRRRDGRRRRRASSRERRRCGDGFTESEAEGERRRPEGTGMAFGQSFRGKMGIRSSFQDCGD